MHIVAADERKNQLNMLFCASMATERPPIIAILGHVDHGKSTLLDYIRINALGDRTKKIVDGEAGGITQHVAAYEITHEREGTEKRITFIDTPGHEAFGAIRSRSANIADVAILIVSAEDGVKKQTQEAIGVIKTSRVPYVVAINKIDSPKADVNRTITSLIENEVYIEGYGGDVPYVPISAKTGAGVEDLLEVLLLVAELNEFTGDAQHAAEGFVVEAHRDPKKGVSGTLIITDGTLSTGQYVVAGSSFAPVRIMEDMQGGTLEEASFSTPIQIIGWNELPAVGAPFVVSESKKQAELDARASAEKQTRNRMIDIPDDTENLAIIPLVIKADVTSTIDAIEHELAKLKSDRVILKTVRSEVGDITEADVKAAGGDGRTIILGFNAKVEEGATELAERSGITIETFNIIYKLSEWLDAVMQNRRPEVMEEQVTGSLKVLKCFSKSKDLQVVGGRVESGTLMVTTVSVRRKDEIVGTAVISELQAGRQVVKHVHEGDECGIKLKSKIEVLPGDRFEVTAMIAT